MCKIFIYEYFAHQVQISIVLALFQIYLSLDLEFVECYAQQVQQLSLGQGLGWHFLGRHRQPLTVLSEPLTRTVLTPVAGLIFDTKIESFFLESFFLEQHYYPRTLFPSMSVEWIHFPRIRTFVQKRFHGLFSKKKRSKSGGVPSFESFSRREHSSGSNFPPVWATNSSLCISREYSTGVTVLGTEFLNFSPKKALRKDRSTPTSHLLSSFFCCCWGAHLRSRSFYYHNHLFPPLVVVLQ